MRIVQPRITAAALAQQVQVERPDELRGVTAALGQVAGQLRGVHRLGGGKVLVLAQVVGQREGDERQHGGERLHDVGAAADFHLVNPFL